MKLLDAQKVTGGLSSPGKMPCRSFNLPALVTCPVGKRIATIEGTSCHDCYALKGRYYFTNVKEALKKRHRLVLKALKKSEWETRWVEAMAHLISKQSPNYFRWHDSGDIFSLAYLDLMLRVIRLTPTTKHWIPTKEMNTIGFREQEIAAVPNATFRWSSGELSDLEEWLPHPRNLVAHVAKFPNGFYGSRESILQVAARGGLLCLAATRQWKGQGQACGNCRACWDPKVKAVVYPLH
jgi:hypothetical protein